MTPETDRERRHIALLELLEPQKHSQLQSGESSLTEYLANITCSRQCLLLQREIATVSAD